MHSWEIVQQRANSCLIAIIVPRFGVSVQWALSLMQIERPEIWDAMPISGLPWGEARTHAAYAMLNGGYQWLFQIDTDILVPKETIPRLMSHRLPIVSGLYYQRFPTWTGTEAEYLPVMFREQVDAQGNRTKIAITDYKPGTLVEADLVPGGCLLVHRSVFERMLQVGIKRFFEWTLTADSLAGGRSEDFEFSARARALGFKPVVDTSIVCLHETLAQVTDKGLRPRL